MNRMKGKKRKEKKRKEKKRKEKKRKEGKKDEITKWKAGIYVHNGCGCMCVYVSGVSCEEAMEAVPP